MNKQTDQNRLELDMPRVGQYDFTAAPFQCDLTGRLSLGNIGNQLLNASDYHSNARGFGLTTLMNENRAWVLSRLAIELTNRPVAYEPFHIDTWAASAMRTFTKRNYRLTSADGHVFGYGTSVWALIDTDTRHPVLLTDLKNGSLEKWIVSDEPCPIAPPSRVAFDGDGELVANVKTGYSDADINGHVNSIKYIEHVLDTMPMTQILSHEVYRIEAAYIAEAHAGDTLQIFKEEKTEGQISFKVTKEMTDRYDFDRYSNEICRIMVFMKKK